MLFTFFRSMLGAARAMREWIAEIGGTKWDACKFANANAQVKRLHALRQLKKAIVGLFVDSYVSKPMVGATLRESNRPALICEHLHFHDKTLVIWLNAIL